MANRFLHLLVFLKKGRYEGALSSSRLTEDAQLGHLDARFDELQLFRRLRPSPLLWPFGTYVRLAAALGRNQHRHTTLLAVSKCLI